MTKTARTASPQNRSTTSGKGLFASLRRTKNVPTSASDRAALRSFARLGLLATSAL